MSGIYVGKFDNGPLNTQGNVFGSCVYLIGYGAGETAVYAFSITQYASGHLFFNRVNRDNSWDFDNWKKLI